MSKKTLTLFFFLLTMCAVQTNVGQHLDYPSSTKSIAKQFDGVAFGNTDSRRSVRESHKISNSYISKISGEETNYAVYAYIFNKSFATIKESDVIYFDDVISKMKKEIEPLIYQIIEVSENKEWLKVFPRFMEFLFFMNTIWVWYDTEEEKFYILLKQNPLDEKDRRYFDLINCKEVVLPTEEAIKCMWDGRENAHFEMWFKECYKCIMRESAIDQLFLLTCKRLKITADNASALVDVEHELATINPYIGIINNATLPEALDLDVAALDSTVKNHYLIWDRSIASLGLITNTNEKAERKTTGENYKDIQGNICRQQSVLSQLKLFAMELEEIKSVKLEFKVLGTIDKTQDMMEERAMDPMGKNTMPMKPKPKPL